jgi:hypothetical protein
MADAIPLYVDLSVPQGRLVTNLNNAAAPVFGPFYQGQLLQLRIFPVVPTGNRVLRPLYSLVALDNLDCQVVVGPAAGAEAIKAAQYVWNKQQVPDAEGLSGYFYADLDLNTNELNTVVGTNATIATQFEIRFSRGAGNFTPVYQTDITIRAVVKDPAGAASIPTPTPSYLTREECFNLFVMWDNRLRAANAGRSIITTSPDQNHTREFGGVDNDGAPTDNLT